MNTQRTIKILALGILTALSAGIASAQTGSLQGRQLFLYDGGTAANLNRITLQTPADATLVANWALTFPATAGTVNQLMVNTGAGVLNWTSSLTLQDLTINGTITLPRVYHSLVRQWSGFPESAGTGQRLGKSSPS
ncbi:MAG: hypothetical protein IPF59_08895 [Ignavibacteria bacterium]|nr:hypothetical protein [Ignavibacteria bacterium]